ncbi:hypothetical protein LEN26_012538 [Aphanomyces euteiches]|nr:hypothetical protein AeMF1_015136 [Aphanomyces euteiches]KAH9117649.1 hypothetical protein LEN26_012538 [Aphanomyces euteiches]KAH9185900.1 hypothetical protein AeNC1_012127 [Aphanomyces euteiches]
MQKGKIRQAHKGDADVDKPKIKKLTTAKVAEVYDASTDHLDLAHRGTESIEPAAFAEHKSLKRLDLSSNKLTRVVFGQPMALTQLKITSNLLTDAGLTDLSFCRSLITLDLTDNKLARLPGASLRHCSQLKALVLTKNALTSLDWLPSLPSLTSLIVSHNRISDVSAKNLGKVKSLTKLSISHNALKVLPDMAVLEQLTELRASNNELTILPSSLKQNGHLKIIDVCHNAIDSFDGFEELSAGLRELKQLNLRGNPLCGQEMSQSEAVDDEKERKALDKKNKLYNFKMKRLFPSLIVRDGHRVQDKRTHGYVAPEPKEPEKPKKGTKRPSSDDKAKDSERPAKKPKEENDKQEKKAKKPHKEPKEAKNIEAKAQPAKETTTTTDAPPAKKKKKDKEAKETSKAIEKKSSESTEKLKTKEKKSVDEPKQAKESTKEKESKDKAGSSKKKKDKYVKDSGVLSVVHVKKPKKQATTGLDLTRLDTTSGVGMGGDSSWD